MASFKWDKTGLFAAGVLFGTAGIKLLSSKDAKKFYTKNVEDTRQLYMSSGTTYLEVISAQANLLNAQISKVTDDFYKMQAVVSLYSALGGGTK